MQLFKPKNSRCSNGGSVQWSSKESIKYSNNKFIVEVWVDYQHKEGEGRVIYKSHIKEWTNSPENTKVTISDEEKENIVKCIIEFLTKNGIYDVAVN